MTASLDVKAKRLDVGCTIEIENTFESLHAHVALDAAGYITRANASLERVLQRAEVVGARWYDLVHPEDVTKAHECIEAAVREGRLPVGANE